MEIKTSFLQMYLISQSVSAGTKPNPCTVRTHQEKRENSATEEI